MCSRRIRVAKRRDLKGFILGVVSLLSFQKEELSFPKGERTLLGSEMEELLTNLSLL